jgi:hypothetical protein
MIRKKPAPAQAGVRSSFPSGQTQSVCPEIMLNQEEKSGMTIRRKVISL